MLERATPIADSPDVGRSTKSQIANRKSKIKNLKSPESDGCLVAPAVFKTVVGSLRESR